MRKQLFNNLLLEGSISVEQKSPTLMKFGIYFVCFDNCYLKA